MQCQQSRRYLEESGRDCAVKDHISLGNGRYVIANRYLEGDREDTCMDIPALVIEEKHRVFLYDAAFSISCTSSLAAAPVYDCSTRESLSSVL